MTRWRLGLDVGSITVKAAVVDAASHALVWKEYRRHRGRQAQETLACLTAMENALRPVGGEVEICLTGSGGQPLAEVLGTRYVQEVTALCAAVEARFPQARTAVDLGGQDAKMVLFRTDPNTGDRRRLLSMNDKCAGGTGAVIDRIAAKLNLPETALRSMLYRGITLHRVASRCGVFAETDISGLQKQGVCAAELIASLYQALVEQNLAVLTRGNTPEPPCVLLGGPHAFLEGLVEAWRENLGRLWARGGIECPAGIAVEAMVFVPADAPYYPAMGAALCKDDQMAGRTAYLGTGPLRRYLKTVAQPGVRKRSSGRGLVANEEEARQFVERYAPTPFVSPSLDPGSRARVFVGIDAGSTSTKAILLSQAGTVMARSYGLSEGDPVEDARRRLGELRRWAEAQGAALEILSVGVTGYAKDLLGEALQADTAVVETVAHARGALHFFEDADVVCDVGGQDIKVIVLGNGAVRDFRLNTQCSAGNGYFLQSVCEGYGLPLEDYTQAAFAARNYPEFGQGCAVFLRSDVVNFQRQGWAPEQILAGLAAIMPSNVWLYVCQMPELARLGGHFVLQGGTHRNLAVVKAQADFIEGRFRGSRQAQPKVSLHPHPGEAGAIGAALEAMQRWDPKRKTTFVGLDALAALRYRALRDESTRCRNCANRCPRTVVELSVDGAPPRKLVVAPCENGRTQDIGALRRLSASQRRFRRDNPNLAGFAARRIWQNFGAAPASPFPRIAPHCWRLYRVKRESLRIGIPRVLDLYSVAPFFTAYLTAVGIPFRNLVFSNFTSEGLYRDGAKHLAIDPCFPSKVCVAHVHNLLFEHHRRKPLAWVLLPMVNSLPPALWGTSGSRACPTVTTTPESVKAAFVLQRDLFRELGVCYVSPLVDFAEPDYLVRQMFQAFAPLLHLTRRENRLACEAGWTALDRFYGEIRHRGREVLEALERTKRLGIVLLGRPYHADPGIHHGVLEQLHRLGYPILTPDSLPFDEETLEALLGEEIRSGAIPHPRDISDVWKNSYCEHSNRKLWAAKFAARHPCLVALELSSFKCGHDAPLSSVVEAILHGAGKPFFALRDMDENRAIAAAQMRVDTIAHALRHYAAEIERTRPGTTCRATLRVG